MLLWRRRIALRAALARTPQFIPQSFLKQHEAEIGETSLKFGPLNLAGLPSEEERMQLAEA